MILDAAGRPYGPAVKDAGYTGIVRYLSDGGSDLPGKLLLPDEAQSYLDTGINLVSNWETTADRMLSGYSGGYADVRQAWYNHKFCNGPDNAVVYFSADFDATEEQQSAINDYLQACIDYLGVQSVGIYGGYYVIERVHEWNPAIYLWQTVAWSGGQVHPDIHILQTTNQVWVNGVNCDVNQDKKSDYGQWNLRIEGNEEMNIKSLVDGKDMTLSQALAYIDYHAWRTDETVKRIAEKQGIDTSDEALATPLPEVKHNPANDMTNSANL